MSVIWPCRRCPKLEERLVAAERENASLRDDLKFVRKGWDNSTEQSMRLVAQRDLARAQRDMARTERDAALRELDEVRAVLSRREKP